MNSYDLSRLFWNWAFDNPENISPNHAAIYFFAIEHCNRLGWKEKFGLPSQMVMDAIGIKKHSTYIKYFNDLVEFKFFVLIQKSKNQYSSNIISLTSAKPKKGEALDKAISKHGEKQTESNGQSTGSINKQVTSKQETINRFLEWFNAKKLEHTNKKGRSKVLTDTDYKNLVNLKKNYSSKDFDHAVINLFNNEWAKENNGFTPTHFLRNDNFNRYYEQERNNPYQIKTQTIID